MKCNSRVSKIEWILSIVYALLIGLAVYLNPAGTQDLANVTVNCAFFAVVLVIFLYVFVSFSRTNRLVKSLKHTAIHIKELYEMNHSEYIWDACKEKNELFDHPLLDTLFREYRDESNRLRRKMQSNYTCDIEDYINRTIIDQSIRRTILSLVPGTMTGLGILGTFIGLSFGLNSFRTGTTIEITKSITPLMNGIKVAFHTSIYGMVFSLMFNFIYKYKLSEAYAGLDQFLEAFANYVVPDAQNENGNELLLFQKQQAETANNLVAGLSEVLAQKMADAMKPTLERMDSILEGQKNSQEVLIQQVVPQLKEFKSSLVLFSKGVTEEQTKGIQLMVDKFLSEMNSTMNGEFDRLKDTIRETCDLQKANGEQMKEALNQVAGMLGEVIEIDEASTKVVTGLNEYINQMEALQSIINDNFMSVNMQMEDHQKMTEKQQKYIEELAVYEANVAKLSATLSASAEEVNQKIADAAIAVMKDVAENSFETMERLGQKRQESEAALLEGTKLLLAQLVKSVQGAVSNMESVRKALDDTTAKRLEQTEKTVTSAYSGIGTTLMRLQMELNHLAKVLDESNQKRMKDLR